MLLFLCSPLLCLSLSICNAMEDAASEAEDTPSDQPFNNFWQMKVWELFFSSCRLKGESEWGWTWKRLILLYLEREWVDLSSINLLVGCNFACRYLLVFLLLLLIAPWLFEPVRGIELSCCVYSRKIIGKCKSVKEQIDWMAKETDKQVNSIELLSAGVQKPPSSKICTAIGNENVRTIDTFGSECIEDRLD